MHPFFYSPLLLVIEIVAWSCQPGFAATIHQADTNSDTAPFLEFQTSMMRIPSVPSIATAAIPQPTPLRTPSRRRTYYNPSLDDDHKPSYHDDDREPSYKDDDRKPSYSDDDRESANDDDYPIYAPAYHRNHDHVKNENNKDHWSEIVADFVADYTATPAGGPALTTVIIMIVLTMIVIGCNWSVASEDFEHREKQGELGKRQEELVKTFNEKLLEDKNLTFIIPRIEVKFPFCGRPLVLKARATRHALFFTTRIKCKWKPVCAWVQFVTGWLSLATSIVGIFAPANAVNSLLGFAAMFISKILVHMWYGYFRYPNVASWFDLQSLDTDSFDKIKIYSTVLYHGNRQHHDDKRIEYVGFIPTIPIHLAAFASLVATCLLSCCCDNCLICLCVFFGSLVYPLSFLFITHPMVKLLAPILHHIVLEYYEAKLFEKDLGHLCLSICFKVVGEALIPIFDETNGVISEVKQGVKCAVDELDVKSEVDKNKV